MNEDKRKKEYKHRFGVTGWFKSGEQKKAEEVLNDLKKLDIKHLRVILSPAELNTDEGVKWYDWLIPKLARETNLLFSLLPYSPGVDKTSVQSESSIEYHTLIDTLIKKFDSYFEWIELLSGTEYFGSRSSHSDSTDAAISLRILEAAKYAKQKEKKVALGVMLSADSHRLKLISSGKSLDYIDAVSIFKFQDSHEFVNGNSVDKIDEIKNIIADAEEQKEVWITEACYPESAQNEHTQLTRFLKIIDSPADRIYYSSMYDLFPNNKLHEGSQQDEHYLCAGLKRSDGSPKLLYRILEKDGINGLRFLSRDENKKLNKMPELKRNNSSAEEIENVLIIGGSGFIGTNLTKHFLRAGKKVTVFDNLSRPGVEENLLWLHKNFPDGLEIKIGDIRNPLAVKQVVANADVIFNFAAQVAVTTSLINPVEDFEVNTKGTLNLLEAVRSSGRKIPIFFTSTNKVYGTLDDVQLYENGTRYIPIKKELRTGGIGEQQPLDFHSPYGCSKGAADQYVLDYSRSYGIPAVVFRMSCIYGTHQYGTEDQGWVAHFMINAINDKPLKIFGDGKQVRDILFVDDLVNAFQYAIDNLDKVKGNAFNIGGGVDNSISLLEIIEIMEKKLYSQIETTFGEWRKGDQKYYVSDISKFNRMTGWLPEYSIKDGLDKLMYWLLSSRIVKPQESVQKKIKSKLSGREILFR